MAWLNCYDDVLPVIANIAAECSIVGLNTLFKAASSEGLSYYVFIVYEFAINTMVLLPLAFFFGRKTRLPSSRFGLFWRICLAGLLCLIASMVGYKGIEYSSPTMASAASNLMPAFTFIMAIIFRMEKLALRSSSFQAKLIGTIVSISGALMVILYKGPVITSVASPKPTSSFLWSLESPQSNWIIGGLLVALEYLIFPLWLIVLTDIMKMYPSELVVTLFHNLCVTIFSIPVCFIAETDLSAWRPKSSTALMAFVFSGFFGPAFLTVIHSWSLHLKGPVYVAIFKPSSIVIAVVTGIVFLGDDLYLGSVIGATILVVGVYAVIWGKAKEEKMMKKCECGGIGSSSSDVKIPLLQSEDIEGV